MGAVKKDMPLILYVISIAQVLLVGEVLWVQVTFTLTLDAHPSAYSSQPKIDSL